VLEGIYNTIFATNFLQASSNKAIDKDKNPTIKKATPSGMALSYFI
jgi:hypothetical protein